MYMMSLMFTAFLILFQAYQNDIDLYVPESEADYAYEDVMINGLEAFYQTEWDEANEYYTLLIEMNPEDPRGYFFSSMIPFWKYFFVTEDQDTAERFLRISNEAIKIAEDQLRKNPEDTALISMLSGLYGYQSLVASGENKIRSALRSGRTGYGYTKQLLEMDNHMPEVYIGRGMHNYMVGSVPAALRWIVKLFGMRGDMETGFKELAIAADSESYVSIDAKMILAYLYKREEQYSKSLEYLYKLNDQFSRNIIFRYLLAETLELNGNHKDAIALYTDIMNSDHKHLGELIELSRERKKELISE
jgi:tetratricopeptide (TPR) repeat protein